MRLAPLVVILLTASPAFASPFVREYDFGVNASVEKLAPAPGGGLYVATRAGLTPVGMARLDASGHVLWSVQEDAAAQANGLGPLVATPDGVALLEPEESTLVVRTADRTLAWRRRVVATDGGVLASVTALASLPDGGFLAGGSVRDPSAAPCDPRDPNATPCRDALLVRLDGFGRVLWSRALDSGAHEETHALLPLPDGDFLAGTWRDADVTTLDHDSVISRHSGDGSLLWSVRIEARGCSYYDRPGVRDLALLPDGDVVASGGGPSCGQDLAWVARLSPAGELRWLRRGSESAGSDSFGWGEVEVLDDGRVAVASRSTVAVLDGDGAVAWARGLVSPQEGWVRGAGLAALPGGEVSAAWMDRTFVARFAADGIVGEVPCHVPAVRTPPGNLVAATVAGIAAFVRPVGVTTLVDLVPQAEPCADPACHELCGVDEVAPAEALLSVTRLGPDAQLRWTGGATPAIVERAEAAPRGFITLATASAQSYADPGVVRDGRLLFYRVR